MALVVVAGYFWWKPVVYWADADSGRWNGIEFRLADVDAPETGHPNSAIGPAGCFEERELGIAAESWIKDYTTSNAPRPSGFANFDRYNRAVIYMRAGGRDLAELGKELGYLRSWKWENGRPVEQRPEWCSVL